MQSQSRSERFEKYLVCLIQTPGDADSYTRMEQVFLWHLKQLSRLYRAVMELRLFLYDKGIIRHHTLGCQVISVGNLTVGGTGKTPVVEVFARELQRAGRKVAILSRGYKSVRPPLSERFLRAVSLRSRSDPPRVVSDGKELLLDCAMSGDEPYMLASNLPDVAVVVDKNRVKSGRYAIGRLGCDTLILDDGFQYLALRHWVEIALVDRTNPFGNEFVLPRGILREPIKHIRRADFIFITKSDGGGDEDLRKRLTELNPKAEIIECRHCARYLQNVASKEQHELGFLDGLRVTVLSGIADPRGFERELRERGATIVETVRFADHHRYSQQEIIDIVNRSQHKSADAIITTEKDAVRFPQLARYDVPVFFLRVDIEILSGEEDFHECIARICFHKTPHSQGASR